MKITASVKNILVISLLLETFCVTYGLDAHSVASVTSILYTSCGIVIAICFLLAKPETDHHIPGPFSFRDPFTRFKWLVMGIVLVAMCHFAAISIHQNPLDYHQADMLPIIKVMCTRMLWGQWSHVYDIIPDIWHGMQPIYLPAMWLPFCLPVWLHIDLRWISVLSLFVCFCILLWRSNPFHQKAAPVLFVAFLLFWWLFTNESAGLIPFTEEGIVVLYYVLLVLAIHSRRAWVMGICASLCVLSRFALIGWLPAMAIFFICYREWKKLAWFAISGLICFLVLVLLPFGWETFAKHIALPSSYIDFSGRVWRDSPQVFNESLGWAKFFGPSNISALHYTLIIASFAVPALFVSFAIWLQRRKQFAASNIPLATLKITLVIFYTFIDVPYLYLFYTSSFVSLIGITYLFADSKKSTSNQV